MEAPKKIDCFDGEYRFLSNFSNDIVHLLTRQLFELNG